MKKLSVTPALTTRLWDMFWKLDKTCFYLLKKNGTGHGNRKRGVNVQRIPCVYYVRGEDEWAAAKINLWRVIISLWRAATKKWMYRKHGKIFVRTQLNPSGTGGYHRLATLWHTYTSLSSDTCTNATTNRIIKCQFVLIKLLLVLTKFQLIIII